MVKCIYYILWLILCVFTQAHARLLSVSEMQSFIETHKQEIANALPGANAHKGYRVIAVAHEKMRNNIFDESVQPKIRAYYAKVILSALKGIGVGGLSPRKRASLKEKSSALLALCEIGYNLKDVFSFDEIGTSEEKRFFKKCNDTLRTGKSYQTFLRKEELDNQKRLFERSLDTSFKLIFQNSKFGIEEGVDYYGSYSRIFASLAEEVRRKVDEEMFQGAVGKRDDLRGPFSRLFSSDRSSSSKGGTSPAPSKVSPQVNPTPPKEKKGEIDSEPWTGALYRDRAAAEMAMHRSNEEVCSNTGNLIVRYFGKPYYSSSTATLIMQGGGNVVAITNAHCVNAEGEIVTSVELHFPDNETVFFDRVYFHSSYNKDANEYDIALLKGKHKKPFSLRPILPYPITPKMKNKNGFLVSCAKVNYLDNGHIVTLAEQARTLSVLRIEKTGSAPLYRAEIPRVVQTTESVSTLKGDKLSSSLGRKPIVFRPQSHESHQLESVLSFGCSGSPFYLRVDGIDYLAGLLDSSSYWIESGLPIRSNNISSIQVHQEWINDVLMGSVHPNYSI